MGPRLVALAFAALLAGCALQPAPPRPLLYAEEVLRAAPFTSLVIEVDHAPGREPGEAALTHLRMTFQNITAKANVTVKVERSLPETAQTWTRDTLIALEREQRSTQHVAPVAVLHVLYPAGTYDAEGVAGVTIAGTVIGPTVVFLDTLREYPLPTGAPVQALPLPEGSVRIVERSTLVHEAGHAIGLVNNGLRMVCPHEDAEHPAHSANEESIMYYAVDSLEGIREMLTSDGRVPDKLDVNDLRDTQQGGGRGAPPPASC